MTASGYLLFDKPAGPTSFSALRSFQKAFPDSRIGHTGTLDSFATGLLVVVAGAYSRLSPWFTGLDKTYEAEIAFGEETDTLENTGRIVRAGPVPSRNALETAIPVFHGWIQQVPPRFSAIHVEGARASDLAKRGKDVDLAPRRIRIDSLELITYEGGKARIRVACSSGTYIRSLARDIAEECGTCAHLSALRRVSVGPFRVEDAVADPEKVVAQDFRTLDRNTLSEMGIESLILPTDLEKGFAHGLPTILARLTNDQNSDGKDRAVFFNSGALAGILGWRDGRPRYKVVMNRQEETL